MNTPNKTKNRQAAQLPRILHTMIRVSNLERSLAFYLGALGMRELRREDYPEGNFTLAFVGYGDEASSATIELTYNWNQDKYQPGTGFGHVAIGVFDIYATCEGLASKGINIIREPNPMSFASEASSRDVIAFIEDPDGYQVEIIEIGQY